ncbi:PIN domain-containing protein [Vibrio sp. Vb2880]|uniref:PIN domain-containing protein n=1 Tax=Vibrio TaxID=662 RepID=UPI0029650EBE|nr:PIN domain-containing protein [Vibrio sp. Vb2880]MDW1578888.1 PIN domain-containing protein [Vibrio sp. Vb2880]
MSNNRKIDEDLEMALSYQEKFKTVDFIFSTSQRTLEESLEDSIVVLDTNVLLIPYKLKKQNLSEIEKVYARLSQQKRLLLPEHVAREFAVNKQSKLADLHYAITQKRIQIPKSLDSAILNDLDEFKAIEDKLTGLNETIESYNKSVKDLAEKVKDWSWNDPVLNMYSQFFTAEAIKNHKKSNEQVGEELSRRQKHSIAPGYKDKSKKDNAAGDLNVWLTILELGSVLKKDIIFVSEDRKPDWWNQSGGSEFSPKFELINEYRNISDGKTIHLLSFSEFLLAFQAAADTVEDVKKVEAEAHAMKLDFSKQQIAKHRNIPRIRRQYISYLEQQGIDSNECEACGFRFEGDKNMLEIHHVLPLSKGGSDSTDNMVLLCPNCHRTAHSNLRE